MPAASTSRGRTTPRRCARVVIRDSGDCCNTPLDSYIYVHNATRPLPLRNFIPSRKVLNGCHQVHLGNGPDLAARDAVEFDQPLGGRIIGNHKITLAIAVELHGLASEVEWCEFRWFRRLAGGRPSQPFARHGFSQTLGLTS